MLLVPWFGEAQEKLLSFKILEYNWDTYGANPISIQAIETADKLLRMLSSETPRAFMVPTSNGGVSFDWPTYELEISPQGYVVVEIPSA